MFFHELMGDAAAEQAQRNSSSRMHASTCEIKPFDFTVPVSVAKKSTQGGIAGWSIECASVAAGS